MSYFIQQYAEKGCPINAQHAFSFGTTTMTKSIEGSDQDMQCKEFWSLGTMTCTESIEGVDQDKDRSFYEPEN